MHQWYLDGTPDSPATETGNPNGATNRTVGTSMNEQLQTYWNLFVGRSNDFAQQRNDGGYFRVGRSLTRTDLAQHLDGQWTLGTYVINEAGRCRCAVFDADSENGLQVLRQLQAA